MKKIISAVLVCVLLVCSVFALASCGKTLSGKYEAELGLAEVTYEFGAFGKVTCTVDPIVGDDAVYEGKYEFNEDGDKITITLESDDEDADAYEGTYEFVENDKYIKLGLIQYNKVD